MTYMSAMCYVMVIKFFSSQNQSERFAFIAEWYDPNASLLRRYELLYYPADGSVEMVSEGWKDGSVGKALALQAWGPEYDAQQSGKMSGMLVPACNPSPVEVERWGLLARWSS